MRSLDEDRKFHRFLRTVLNNSGEINLDSIKDAIKKGLDPFERNDLEPDLFLKAALQGNREVLQYLFSLKLPRPIGAFIYSIEGKKNTSLLNIAASSACTYQVFKIVFANKVVGIDFIDSYRMTPLVEAMHSSCAEKAKDLIINGSDISRLLRSSVRNCYNLEILSSPLYIPFLTPQEGRVMHISFIVDQLYEINRSLHQNIMTSFGDFLCFAKSPFFTHRLASDQLMFFTALSAKSVGENNSSPKIKHLSQCISICLTRILQGDSYESGRS